jgi:phosphomannomutase
MIEEQIAGSPVVCGYEANGGFLLGTAIIGAHGSVTRALPTRDALMPILLVLTTPDVSVSQQLASLPMRYTFSDRLTPFPSALSKRLFYDLLAGGLNDQLDLQNRLFGAFGGRAREINLTDGVRTYFDDGLIVHLRGSGNAPELRCYTEADSENRAIEVNRLALDSVQSFLNMD